MAESLNILFVTSEVSPVVGSGGLAEVAGALPKELRAKGHDVRLIIPCHGLVGAGNRGEQCALVEGDMSWGREYGALRQATLANTGIPLYLVEHDGFFSRPGLYDENHGEYPDNAERFSFFAKALLHGMPQLDWRPDILHVHDWHTGPLVGLLKTEYRDHPFWGGMPVLFTIHNLQYQGRYDKEKYRLAALPPELFHPGCAEFYGDMNMMKMGILLADKLNTVSPRYAQESQTDPEYGFGLEDAIRSRAADFSGILNGVDYSVWNPETDENIPANYGRADLAGKRQCARELRAMFGLHDNGKPIVGLVTRMSHQKGLDLLLNAMEQIMDLEVQIVLLGSGDTALESGFHEQAHQYPGMIGVATEYNPWKSHHIMAGCDFVLMPSRFEPCGLAQMYGMKYGAVPIVRRTGGLANSVCGLNPVTQKAGNATGISFVPRTTRALTQAVGRARALYENPELYQRVRANALCQDFSWGRSCERYISLYREILD